MYSRLKIFSGNANIKLSNEVAKYAGIPLSDAEVFKFSNDNTFVKMCALDNVIKSGARFLDFEIYSMSGEPVISVSNVDDFNTQQSFRQLGFKEVMSRIKTDVSQVLVVQTQMIPSFFTSESKVVVLKYVIK